MPTKGQWNSKIIQFLDNCLCISSRVLPFVSGSKVTTNKVPIKKMGRIILYVTSEPMSCIIMGKYFVTKSDIAHVRQTAIELTQTLSLLLRSSGVINQGRGPKPIEKAIIYTFIENKGSHHRGINSIPLLSV
jgi:hypothetical protein